jgi:tetratricopeptide (TPR) repeat protein
VPDLVFVSCAGADRKTADSLIAAVPKGLIRIYTHNFVDGASLIAEMERNVRDCSAFLFLASKAALASVWCQHEIALAQIENITKGARTFVLTLEGGVDLTDLPPWMRAYWISQTPSRLPAVRRRFLDIVESNTLRPILSGHETRVDKVHQAYLDHAANFKAYPNVFFLTGVESIGRHTTARLFFTRLLNNRRFGIGPDVALEDPASIVDLYLKLREEYAGPLGASYVAELDAFRNLDEGHQVEEIDRLILASCRDDETVFISCRSGLFDGEGYLLDWARQIISNAQSRPQERLVIVSTRAPRGGEARTLPNLLHFHVNRLNEAEIDALVREVTLSLDGVAATPSVQARVSIGGHPVLAKHYAYAVRQYGQSAEERAVYETILEQRNMFSEFLSFDNLDSNEKAILAILSWLPQIGSEFFDELCAAVGVSDQQKYLHELILASLVEYQGGRYAIGGPVRLVFRQLYGDGDREVGLKVAEALAKRVAIPDELTNEMVDLVSYILTVFGKDFPRNVERIISPSGILRAARVLYQRGRDRSGPLENARVVELCVAGLNITKEPALQRDFKGVQARALMRMHKFDEADKIIRDLEGDGGRQATVLRAQFHRFRGEFDKAIPVYRSAIAAGYTDDAILHEYCLCLRKVGNYEEVTNTIERHSRNVARNPYLLSTKASIEIGSGKFKEAAETIRALSQLPDSREMAAEKEAILIYKTTNDFGRALDVINSAIERAEKAGIGPLPDLVATRCLIYCKLNMVPEARADLNIVRNIHREGEFVASRLRIHLLLAEKHAKEALAQFEKLSTKTRIDNLLKRETLQALLDDPQTSLADRARYDRSYKDTFAANVTFTEFDF